MDVEEMATRGKHANKLKKRVSRKYNPALNPYNQWTWRFLPGLLLGYGLARWLDLMGRSRRNTKTRSGAPRPASAAQAAGAAAQTREHEAVQEPDEELKMVLVVNEELKMGKGKIAAQCAHAAVGAVSEMSAAGRRGAETLAQWEMCGQPKIALRIPSGPELNALALKARNAGCPIYVVQDAGRTQVAPGSRTVLAIGPAAKSLVDSVSGGLKLL
ncbi:unnamed protein product [Pedinophyceae sp. YPF-701]|nr:unnamed protein product [Pedinophyceae sp. YPF-701]